MSSSPRPTASCRGVAVGLVAAALVAATAGGACGSRRALVVAAADAGPGDAAPEAPGADAPSPPTDADADARVATAEAGALTSTDVYLAFVQTRRQAQIARYAECFGIPADTIAEWRGFVDPLGTAGLELGLAELDVAALDACLATIATATCPQIASGALDAACAHPFRGLVARGGYCFADSDCAGPGNVACAHGSSSRCASSCVLVPPTPTPPLPADGERCDVHGCAGGDYCRWDGPHAFTGVCRPSAPGGPCDGAWSCPFFYTCLFDDAGRGTCGIGHGVGAPCRLYGFDALNGPVNDCANLACTPDDQNVFRCQKGQAVGQSCAEISPPQPGENGGPRPCLHAYCDPETTLCAPLHASGTPCANEWECGPGGSCVNGVCLSSKDPPLAVGAACTLAFDQCARGLYCWPNDPSNPSQAGTCRPPLADGEACDGPGCGLTSDCVGGVCRSCSR